MSEPNIVTVACIEAAVLVVVDKKRKGYRILEILPDTVVGLHKAFLYDAILIIGRDKLALVAAVTTMYPDYKCLE